MRARVDPIDSLNDQILAMTWDGLNACRMWFRRRGTTPTKLGLRVLELPGGRVRVIDGRDSTGPSPGAPGREVTGSAAAESVQQSVEESVALVEGVVQREPNAAELAAFEAFADRVDNELADRGAAPERDDVVREFFQRGLSAQQTVESLLLQRSEFRGQLPPEVVRETMAQQALAPHADTPPAIPPGVEAIGNPERFFVQLGMPMEFQSALKLATSAAALSRVDAFICDARDGRGVQRVAAPVRAAHVSQPKQDQWSKVAPLLERRGGASVDECKQALGWQTAPGKWFFEKWARAHQAYDRLVDLGIVGGERRFALGDPC